MSRYTKRHYIDIATLLHGERNDLCEGLVDSIAAKFSDMFENDNENFNRGRFMMAIRTGQMPGGDIQGGPAMQYYKNAVDYSGDKPRAPHKGRRNRA